MRGLGWRAVLVILVVMGSIGSTFVIAARAAGVSDLRVDAVDNPDPVTEGQLIRYRITVKNTGPNTSTVTVDFDLPSGGTIQDVDSQSMGSCSAGATSGSCTSSKPLRARHQGVIDVFVQAALPSPTALHAHVSGSSVDPSLGNNDDTENTIVTAQNPDEVSGFIPPGGGQISDCGGSGPTSPDDTCATLIATGGPGGFAKIAEDPAGVLACALLACLGSAADVNPPGGYTNDQFLTLNLDYDVTEIPTGDGAAIVEKLLIDQIALPCITGPNRVFPCLDSMGRIAGDDYRFTILLTSADPKFQGVLGLG